MSGLELLSGMAQVKRRKQRNVAQRTTGRSHLLVQIRAF